MPDPHARAAALAHVMTHLLMRRTPPSVGRFPSNVARFPPRRQEGAMREGGEERATSEGTWREQGGAARARRVGTYLHPVSTSVEAHARPGEAPPRLRVSPSWPSPCTSLHPPPPTRQLQPPSTPPLPLRPSSQTLPSTRLRARTTPRGLLFLCYPALFGACLLRQSISCHSSSPENGF